jgi:hypothetical protein
MKRILFATSGSEANLSANAVKATTVKVLCRSFITVAILLCVIGAAPAQPRDQIKLNEHAFAFARQLIGKGHFVADHKGAWSEHRPSTDDENEFIRVHGFSEYAKWHLGIDERYAENTKRRYKFPYGDFKNVHRCGVLAVESRANEHRYSQVENAAVKLRTMIEAPRDTR